MLIKGSSIFSSGSHFVQHSRKKLAVLVEGHPRNIFCEIILILGHWPWRRCPLKVFLISAVAAIMFGREEPVLQFW